MTADIDIERKATVYVLLLRVSKMAKDQLTFSNLLCIIAFLSAFDLSRSINYTRLSRERDLLIAGLEKDEN